MAPTGGMYRAGQHMGAGPEAAAEEDHVGPSHRAGQHVAVAMAPYMRSIHSPGSRRAGLSLQGEVGTP